LTRSDDSVIAPIEVTEQGIPIFERFFASGFSIVLEGRRGGTNADLGLNTFDWNPFNPTVLPDLQIVVSRAIGDGSLSVCDDVSPPFGGVPAVEPPEFGGTQFVANAINDFSCRFKDGLGLRRGRDFNEACTKPGQDEVLRFVDSRSSVQYCGLVNEPLSFPLGDTVVTAVIRDVDGNISAARQIVVRISPR
jgi:hypothetical protein